MRRDGREMVDLSVRRNWWAVASVVAGLWLLPASMLAAPPAQNLPSAYIVFPYIDANGASDTRIEILNLSGSPQELECFFIHGDSCLEIGFRVHLTPYQPISWFASNGLFDQFSGSAAPPFFGTGELKCVVLPTQPEIEFHNAIQGRAIAYESDGSTVSYNAIAFQRFQDGEFDGTVNLNGSEYAQCPSRLHFDILTSEVPRPSELVLVTCDEDLLRQIPFERTVQILVINEFEQVFSGSTSIECFDHRPLRDISTSLTTPVVGTDTAHLILRGVQGGLLGLVIDAVQVNGTVRTAGNPPFFEGGRSATVVFP